ncbi:MAG: type II toxin-antitoxin system VapC family toxin [Dermatophilaceae bacterium]
MIVVDASVLVDALLDDGVAGEASRQALTTDPQWVAPEHMLTEVLAATRGRVLAGKVTEDRGAEAIRQMRRIDLEVVRLGDISDRVWGLRHGMTAYDAAYVAAAETRDCAVVTRDRKFARTPGIRCSVITV